MIFNIICTHIFYTNAYYMYYILYIICVYVIINICICVYIHIYIILQRANNCINKCTPLTINEHLITWRLLNFRFVGKPRITCLTTYLNLVLFYSPTVRLQIVTLLLLRSWIQYSNVKMDTSRYIIQKSMKMPKKTARKLHDMICAVTL